MKYKSLALFVSVGLVVSACSGETTTNDGGSAVQESAAQEQDAAPASTAPASEPAEEPGEGAEADAAPGDEAAQSGTVAWGRTYTSPTKRKIVAGMPKPWTPSEYAATEGNWDKYAKVTLTLVNDADEPFDASELIIQATSGDRASEQVFDDGVGSPDRTVLAGRKLSFDLAFGYEPGVPLTVEVSTFDGPVVTFDGVVK